MANKNQHFGELEYCFNQYFSKYCAPIITKDYRYYHRKQNEEITRSLQNNANAFTPISAQIHTAQNTARSMKWGKKTIDDFIKAVHYCPVKILDLEINRVDHHPLGR